VAGYETRRGFVDSVSLVAQQLDRWGQVLACAPTARQALLRRARGRLGPVASSPCSAQLERLDVGGVPPAELAALAASPHLAGLRLLKLHQATVEEVIALLASPLPVRRVFLLWYCNGSDRLDLPPDGLTLWVTSFSMRWQAADLPRLWACPHWRRVESLWLCYRRSPNQGIADPLGEQLRQCPHLGNLRELRLDGNGLNDTQVRLLASCPSLLAGNEQVGSAGIAALADGKPWPALEVLTAWGCALGDAGLRHLLRSANFPRLTALLLAGNGLTDEGVLALVRSPLLARLERLELAGAALSHDGLRSLVEAPQAAGLRELQLGPACVGPAEARLLAGSASLGNLSRLWLCHAPLGDEGVTALARSTTLRSLERLWLGDAKCTPAVVDVVLDSPLFARLSSFFLKMPGPAGERLKERFGKAVTTG
jgi:hypothetical protein